MVKAESGWDAFSSQSQTVCAYFYLAWRKPIIIAITEGRRSKCWIFALILSISRSVIDLKALNELGLFLTLGMTRKNNVNYVTRLVLEGVIILLSHYSPLEFLILPCIKCRDRWFSSTPWSLMDANISVFWMIMNALTDFPQMLIPWNHLCRILDFLLHAIVLLL